MYDFRELRAYAEAVANSHEQRENYEQVVAQRKVAEGWVVVSHTGGGNMPENRIYNYFTNETLAVLEDTIEAMDKAWQSNWYHADRLAEDALELYDFPKPEQYITGTGGMPQGMVDALIRWIEEEEDNDALREFADSIEE